MFSPTWADARDAERMNAFAKWISRWKRRQALGVGGGWLFTLFEFVWIDGQRVRPPRLRILAQCRQCGPCRGWQARDAATPATSLRLCFPQEPLKLSHCATRLCPCGFRFRRVMAMHEASLSRPFKPFRRARPGAFAAMQPTAPVRHGRSPARSSTSASLCSAARACIGDCKTRFP